MKISKRSFRNIRKNKLRLFKQLGLFVVALLTLAIITADFDSSSIANAAATGSFANSAFANAWQQLDGPVSDGKVQRPYFWGTPNRVLTEPYSNNQAFTRQVQYFQKGRMELNNPQADPNSPNFVGDGRLVRELVTGQLQVGANRFLQYDAAEIPVSGDKTLARNPNAPTYRAFRSLFTVRASAVGKQVRNVLVAPEGEGLLQGFRSLDVDNALGSLTKFAVYFNETGHNIPDVFWGYLNQTDANGEKLFNWEELFGLPLTDAYWTKVRENGKPQDILVQLFERRTLLYNPALATGFQVYSGDVGTDYYNWRYNLPELPVYDNSVLPSTNAQVEPALGEGGTTFQLTGSGFTPGEITSAWIDEAGAQFPQKVKINSSGGFQLHLRTLPVFSTSQKIRLVVIGNSSGHTGIFNISIANVLRYTPAVEAVQPKEVPPSINGSLGNSVISVGGSTTLKASGFQAGEPLAAWLSTPLNRVVTYQSLVHSSSISGSYPFKLVADNSGKLSSAIPAPGSAEPGIYAFTVRGSKSGVQAVFYFRVRTGSIDRYNPIWGLFSDATEASVQFNFENFDSNSLAKPLYTLEQDN